jgi:hypothetical protein
MMLLDEGLQAGGKNVGVDLRGRDIGVAEQLLQAA